MREKDGGGAGRGGEKRSKEKGWVGEAKINVKFKTRKDI
jgi:hypothetical protein